MSLFLVYLMGLFSVNIYNLSGRRSHFQAGRIPVAPYSTFFYSESLVPI